MSAFRCLAIVSGLLLPVAAQAATHHPHHAPAQVRTATFKTPMTRHHPHTRMAAHHDRAHLAQLHRHINTRGS